MVCLVEFQYIKVNRKENTIQKDFPNDKKLQSESHRQQQHFWIKIFAISLRHPYIISFEDIFSQRKFAQWWLNFAKLGILMNKSEEQKFNLISNICCNEIC